MTIARFLAGSMALVLAVGSSTSCRHVEPIVAEPPTPTSIQPAAPIPPAAPPRDEWPELFLRVDELTSEPPRLVVGDLAMTRAEFRAGLEDYRRRFPDAADPEAEYEAVARRQLLLLEWLHHQRDGLGASFEDQVRAELRASLADRALAHATDVAIDVTEADVRARYERDIASYRQPARVSIEMILVSSAEQATQLKRAIDGGADFAALARAQSQHSSSASGGVLPPFSRGTYSAALEDLAFALKPGEIGSVASERGVFVVRKIADAPEAATPLDSVREVIAETIRSERLAEAQGRFIQELERASIAGGAMP